jgi:hypothetical protein
LAPAFAGTANWFLNEWKNTHEYTYNTHNYTRGQYVSPENATSGLFINTGAGNDTVTNWGSGAWDVRLGIGNDTYYSDNTGNRAAWVFNTTNQSDRNYATAREINDLRSDNNDTYANFRGRLSVTLTLPNRDGSTTGQALPANQRPTYQSLEVALGSANGVTDLEINQAIKTAINTDPVLSKLLEAVDGPRNTLVVRSLIDGAALDSFDPNATNRGGFNGLQVNFLADTGFTANEIIAKGNYVSALASDWTAVGGELSGARSVHTTANRVHIESGQDVVVLSTGAQSEDVLVFDNKSYAANSKTTVVHFDTQANTPFGGGDPIFDGGSTESFVATFGNLTLGVPGTPATVLFNGGTAVTIGNLANNPVIPAVDVVSAFFAQLQASTIGGYGLTGPANVGTSVTPTGTEYVNGYWNRTTAGSPDLYKFTVGGGASGNGNISIATDGAPLLVAVTATENTAALVATEIHDAVNAANGGLGILYGGTYWTASFAPPATTDTIILTAASSVSLTSAQVTAFAPNDVGNVIGGGGIVPAAALAVPYVNGYQDNGIGTFDTYQFTIDRTATAQGVFSIPDGAGTLDVNYAPGDTASVIATRIVNAINVANTNAGISYGGAFWRAAKSADDTVVLTASIHTVNLTNDFELDPNQVVNFQPIFTSSSVTGDSFYWYVDGDGRTWEVESANNGTGLRFTRIVSSTNNAEPIGPEDYVNPDPGQTARVDTVYSGLFDWSGLNTPTANPITIGSIVEGRDNGHEATAARIVVDYAGSAALYTGSFAFGDPTAPVATVNFLQGDGDITIAGKVAAAINAASGWTARASGTQVTITHDATGSLDDSSTPANEWANWYAAPIRLGGGTTGQTTVLGTAVLTLEADLANLADGGNFFFHGLPVTVANVATPTLIATAIAGAFNLARANGTLPTALQGWNGAVVTANLGGAGELVFTQTTPAELTPASVAAAFPDTLFTTDTTVRGVGFVLDDSIHVLGGTVPPSVTFQVKLPDGATTHPGGVITVGNGTAASINVIIPSGSTATQIAAAIDNAINNAGNADYASSGKFWEVQATGAFLTFSAVTGAATEVADNTAVLPPVLAQLISDVAGSTANFGIRAVADPASVANTTGLAELVDDSAPAVGVSTILGDNGIVLTPITSTDGASQVGNPIGSTEQMRATFGDGDYLDFSAWDVVRVTQGGSYLAGDTSAPGNVVNITGGADGVYTFTLIEGAVSTVVGVLDFGQTVPFDDSNFILFNDIIV